MSHITIHHTKQEWEGNTCQKGRISFRVSGDAVSVDSMLENSGEIVGLDVSGWSKLVSGLSFDLSYG